MDSYREHPSDFEPSGASETTASHDVAAAIGTDERRMHVRAYNHWVALLDGREFPSIEDLEPDEVVDFAAHSVLLDFTCGRGNPAIPYIGAGIREECGLDDDARTIADVPSRSLLSRLTDHYMQIIANRAPIGFEAEFMNQRGENICYRGILMPFSSDGEVIDFIYGVINWKTVGAAEGPHSGTALTAELTEALQRGNDDAALVLEDELPTAPEFASDPDDSGEPIETSPLIEPFDAVEEFLDEDEPDTEPEIPSALQPVAEEYPAWEDSPSADLEPDVPPRVPFGWEADGSDEPAELVLDENAGLADRLWAARETAETVKAGEGRTRASLYRALSLAYDFAVTAQHNPEEYAELLEESGMKAQARAPMTPIVKLVFGIDYDKARLTEFASALSYAQRQQVELGDFQDFIQKQAGGLKALVAAERDARRPEPKPDTLGETARARLRSAPAMSLSEIPAAEEFAVVITRRCADGSHEPIAVVDDEALIERVIRKSI
jgi:hypothetical protein